MDACIALVEPDLTLSFCFGDVAIVGNSGRLKGSGLGREINTYNDVIRFNRATTIGHEEDVGGKETLRVVNGDVWEEQHFQENQNVLYIGPDEDIWHKKKQLIGNSCSVYRFKYEYISFLKNAVRLYTPQNPTVSFIMVALCVLNDIRPHLYGFDTEEEEDPSVNTERNVLRSLNERGNIVLH